MDISELVNSITGEGGDMPSIDPAMLMKVSCILKELNGAEDGRGRLIADIRPYMSGERAKRCDEAQRILKLLRVWDILQKEGL